MTEKNNIIKSINKNVRSGARKANLVLKFIKGKKADVALRDLEFTRKKVALDIKKTVKSAIANAENNYQYDIDNLYVKEAFVGKSIVMKRFRPRAKGRAAPIKKPYSRVTIILEEKKEVFQPPISEITKYKCKKNAMAKKPKNDFFSTLFTIK